jgi:hypothetical protein
MRAMISSARVENGCVSAGSVQLSAIETGTEASAADASLRLCLRPAGLPATRFTFGGEATVVFRGREEVASPPLLSTSECAPAI